MSTSRRIGILGGTFDPIHCGHLDAADLARHRLHLDRVMIVPSHVPPHRLSPRASSFHRFAMVALAVHPRPYLEAMDLELRTPGPSYTARTLQGLQEVGYGPDELFFIAGADAFAEIETWKHYPDVLNLCRFAVVTRPGFPVWDLRSLLPALAPRMAEIEPGEPPADAGEPGGQAPILLVDGPTAPVSSTGIRRVLAEGGPLAGLVPPEVESHIRRHRLYSPADPGGHTPA
jgi:nicotinate-nucleotide adenylyltransferase